jgi:hypothetical protein
MKYLKIQNDGVLDIRLVALMGGTTKSKDKYKIGQFGTGLKYALAYLFRNNLDFKIFCGAAPVDITLDKEIIGEEVFEIICINGHRTSITTNMGESWEAWMIVREFWCNALDEGGAVREVTDQLQGEDGKTTIYIQMIGAIPDVLNTWDKYFIHEQEAVFSNEQYALYPAGNHLTIYKQGVLIYEREDTKSIFSYDLKCADINELREFRGSPTYAVTMCLHKANEKAVRYFLENVTDEHFEGKHMDYDWYVSFGEAWRTVIGSAKLIYPKVLSDLKARGAKPDEASLIVVPHPIYKLLTKQFEGIGAVTVASKIANFYPMHNEETHARVKQGLTILEHCGYVMHPELEFVFGFFEDKTTQAQVLLKEKKVYINNALLQQPLFVIIAMLVEENEHFNTGLSDETREFQQHFINLYTRQLLAGKEIEI